MSYVYNKQEWRRRIRNRSDMSGYLTHLTKPKNSMSIYDILSKMLSEKTLVQSDVREGFIIGNHGAVCFQDVPLYGACQNSFYEQNLRKQNDGMKVRYNPVGLAFKKDYVFNKGGRPVIYETKENAKSFLPKDEWWRIVNFDLSNDDKIVDWTHEREWRIKGDFHFELKEAFVLVTHRVAYERFLDSVDDSIVKELGGITVLDPVLS